MNKKEAIIAMLKGEKVRDKVWNSREYLVMNEYHNFRDESGESVDLNYLSGDGWELYNEPEQDPKCKKKIKLYRAIIKSWETNCLPDYRLDDWHSLKMPNLHTGDILVGWEEKEIEVDE